MNTYDLGTGFAAGLQQGMSIGLRRREMEESRAQQLADEARRQQIADSQRAEALMLDSRRFAATHPQAALGEVAAMRQLGPLPQNAALMEGIATPLAFADYQREQQQTASAAELMALRREQAKAEMAAQAVRSAAIREDMLARRAGRTADTVGRAAGSFGGAMLESSPLARSAVQLASALGRPGAMPKPQYDTVETTSTDDQGNTTKTTRRVPAGSDAPKSGTSTAAPAGRASAFSAALDKVTDDITAADEAKRKAIKAEKEKIEAAKKEADRQTYLQSLDAPGRYVTY